MNNLAGVVRLLKKEQDRLTRELRNWCRARRVWQVIRKGNKNQKAVRLSSGADCSCPKTTLG